MLLTFKLNFCFMSLSSALFSNDSPNLSYLFHGRLVQFHVLLTRLQSNSDADILRSAHEGDLEKAKGDYDPQNQAQQPVSLHHNDFFIRTIINSANIMYFGSPEAMFLSSGGVNATH